MAITNSPSCFPREKLAEFATGRVSTDQLDVISAHVDTCVSCQATVADLAEEPDSFVVALRALPPQTDEPADESACQLALEQLVEHRSLTGRPPIARSPMPPSIGAYRVLEPIAAGGMGMVYKAQHPKLKRTVAIKLLPLQQWAGSAAVSRFEREMEVIGGLDHPNIVRASDAGDAGGTHYLVMDFIDGLDLSRLVHRMGPLPMADACEIVRQAALGLAHVHAASLVHRDIKPSNIMLTQDGHVKILDLGLAMLGEQYREGENNLTTIGQLMGTLDYMAPEQAADSRQVDARADIYSLGATLFKLLTGQAPYGGPSHRSLLKKVLALANAPVPSLRELRPELPEELDGIVGKCLAKDPETRYTHVSEVAEALASFAASNNLTSLMKEAQEKAHRDHLDPASWPVPMPSAAAVAPKPAAGTQLRAASSRKKWIVGTLVATVAVAVIALSTVIIRLATDRGELIVRSDDPNARILIKRTEDQSAQEMNVEQGAGKITIKSGHYAVELLGDADTWSLNRSQFTIARGGQILLHVERREMAETAGAASGLAGGASSGFAGGSGMGGSMEMMSGGSTVPGMSDPFGGTGPAMGQAMSDPFGSAEPAMGQGVSGWPMAASQFVLDGAGQTDANQALKSRLVYDGKTYAEWLTIVDTERSPNRLLEAVNAIRILAPETNSEEAAGALLRIMRAFGSQTIDNSSQGQLIEQTMATLPNLGPDAVAKALAVEISEGNRNSREFLLGFVGRVKVQMQMASTAARPPYLVLACPQMMPKLLEMSRDTNAELSRWALELAGSLAVVCKPDVAKIEGFLLRFREAIHSQDEEAAYHAAVTLSYFAPETEGLADIFVNNIGTPLRWEALPALARLGPHASAAVPRLSELLLAEDQGFGLAGGFAAGMMGSGGSMGGMGDGMGGMGGGMGGGYNTVTELILSTFEQCVPTAASALPILQKYADVEGPNQERIRQLIERIQAAAAAQPAHEGKPSAKEGGR